MTEEQRKISFYNFKKAVNHFKHTGEWFEHCILHHKDPSWKDSDTERYIQWNPEDLIVMSKEEHCALHSHLRGISEETKRKISESLKGKPSGMLGKHHSEESKEKIRTNNTGKKRSTETCERISKSKLGVKHSVESWNKGKHWKLIDGKRLYY